MGAYSAKVTYKSSDDAIATVDTNGTVKGIKAGKVTITATANKVSTTKDIVIKNGITVFKAATPKKLTVKFAGALESVAKENFTLTDAKGAKVAIQKATLDETKTIVTLDLYSELTTATDYTVSVKVGDDTYTDSLTFVKGAVAKIVAANQIVKAGSSEAIKYTVYDENGLDITDSTVVSFNSNVAITDGKINLANGVLAYVTITYVNPTTGAEVKSETFTVTGSTSAAASIVGVTVSTTAINSTWPKTTSTSVAKGETNAKLYTQYVDQYGNKTVATNGTDVSYESLDPSILIVDAKSGVLTTIAEGTAQVKVTSGSVSQVFTITVSAAAKATSLAVDASSVLKASKTNATVNKASVKVNVLDQNGKDFNNDSSSKNLTFTLTSGDGVVANNSTTVTSAAPTVNATAGTAVEFTAVKAGTAIFKVTSNDSSIGYKMVSIVVYDTDDIVVKYGLTGVKDLNIQDKYDEDDNTNDYKTTVSLEPLNKDGFVVDETTGITGVTIKVTKPDKSVVDFTSGNEIDASAADYNAVGTYTIVAAKDGVTIATATFTVKDTGVQPVVTIKKNALNYADVNADTKFAENFETETGYEVTGVKFVSGNSSVIASTGDTAVTALAAVTGASNANVTLYNVVVVVKNSTTSRTYSISTGQQISVSGVSAS